MQRTLLYSLMEGKERDVRKSELANAIGVCKTYISNFFSYKNDLTFPAWLLSIRFLQPEREEELVDTLADMMIRDEDKLDCRLLMEYASTSRNFNLLEKLISTQMFSTRVNKDFAQVYSIALKFQRRKVSNEDLLLDLATFRPHTEETAIFANLLRAMVCCSTQEYKAMFRLAKITEKQISKIKNPFLRESYMARVAEIFAKGYLYLHSDVKKARFYATTVTNSRYLSDSYKSHMFHLLGTSYMFEDHGESVKAFSKYRDILKGGGRYDLAQETEEKDIFFANVLWEQNVTVEETSDPLEQMHFFARRGDIETVERLYNLVPQEDPFALCYLGMARKDPELLLRSIAKFVERGDRFFTELPRQEINSHPMHVTSAEIICSIKIA
jgi:hypothetical protein